MPSRGFSVRLYFPDGDPRGLRIIERSGWTGQGIAFPRAVLSESKQREELKRTGVYVLWDRDPAGIVPQVYIGQSDNVLSRLVEHDKTKDFWTDAIAFTSKDDHFNSAHARYIESVLIRRAKELAKCDIENSNEPNAPRVSQADADDAQHFLDQVTLCLPIIGLTTFEPAATQSSSSEVSGEVGELFIDYRTSKSQRLNGVYATGFRTVDRFVVQAGSLGPKQVQRGGQTPTQGNERVERDSWRSESLILTKLTLIFTVSLAITSSVRLRRQPASCLVVPTVVPSSGRTGSVLHLKTCRLGCKNDKPID